MLFLNFQGKNGQFLHFYCQKTANQEKVLTMGLQNLFQLQKVLIEKEKFFFKKFKETKKAFFTRKNALFYFYTLYYIYCIITHQPEQLHDGCKKQESNP